MRRGARDLRVLLSGPFALEEVLPFDLFPQTHHVESIAFLRRRHMREAGARMLEET